MDIHVLYANNALKNFSFIIENKAGKAFVVDPYDKKQMDDFLTSKNLKLEAILNTHEHHDHIKGNSLQEARNCKLYTHKSMQHVTAGSIGLEEGDVIKIEENALLKIFFTPGHTPCHSTFLLEKNEKAIALFSGDSLMNGGVGNCKNGGHPPTFFKTIWNKLRHFPEDIIIYSGHHYLANNLKFHLSLDPEHDVLKKYLAKVDSYDNKGEYFFTSLKEEKIINPFLRLDDPMFRKALGPSIDSEEDAFIEIRKRRDHW